jgi:type IV pilus assembly protein PilO
MSPWPTAIKREQQVIVLVALAALVGVGVCYAVVVGPLLRSLRQQRESLRTARASLQQIEQAIAREPQWRTQLDALTFDMKALHEAMPAEEALPAVIERLSEMATRAGLKIQTIFPQRTTEGRESKDAPTADLYKEVPIQIDALSGYHQLGMFLSSVERHAQPMRLKNLRITSNNKDGKRHNVKMVVVAYFATSQAKHAEGASASTAESLAR